MSEHLDEQAGRIMVTEKYIESLSDIEERCKRMVGDSLGQMTGEQASKSARLNQVILDALNNEPDDMVSHAAGFMAIQSIAAGWREGFALSMEWD